MSLVAPRSRSSRMGAQTVAGGLTVEQRRCAKSGMDSEQRLFCEVLRFLGTEQLIDSFSLSLSRRGL